MNHYDSSFLRQLWSLIELHAASLRGLTDEAIALWLTDAVQSQIRIPQTDTVGLQEYLLNRRCLIRDMVEPPSYI
jgi:hypothetical protein